ncbi:MAG TPA: NAD(P)-dependent alcohol dehydrogenase [Acidimicrobiia bacterium]|nr:NAD(P)-dependent alcohol dehydrogenase [Acidimicrobiia bacterium]
MAQTMKAAVALRYGPPDVVQIADVPRPVPAADELLVRVRATTVNRTDCGYRGGKPFIIRFFGGLRRPKFPIWGTEFSGVVEAIGTAVTAFDVGDRVLGWCEGTFGSHAGYMTVRADRPLVMKVPDGATFAEVAPSTEGAHYAMGFLRRTGVGPGDDVMVYGASGTIGTAAVSFAKILGARVTAVCGSDAVELVGGLGADRVVDYQTENVYADEQRYDVIVDAVGKRSFLRMRRLLKPKGIYTASERPMLSKPGLFAPVFIGWLLTSWITGLLRGRRMLFIAPQSDPDGLRVIREAIASGGYRPVIDRTYPLDEIVEAYRYAESGRKLGNLVIDVDGAGEVV